MRHRADTAQTRVVTLCSHKKSSSSFGREKSRRGNDNQGSLSLQGSIDILDRHIKIKGSLIADAVRLRKGRTRR